MVRTIDKAHGFLRLKLFIYETSCYKVVKPKTAFKSKKSGTVLKPSPDSLDQKCFSFRNGSKYEVAMAS